MKSLEEKSSPSSSMAVLGYCAALVSILLLAAWASSSLPAFSLVATRSETINALSNAKQILTTLDLYAEDHDGAFPEKDPDGHRFTSSTEVFRELMRETRMNDEDIFYVPGNPTKQPPNGDGYLEESENCFVYVIGLNSSSPCGAPIIAEEMIAPGVYGGHHPWLKSKKSVVGYVCGKVRVERLDSNHAPAKVKGQEGIGAEKRIVSDIFQPRQQAADGRITGGLMPPDLTKDDILLP